jgi:hypothetical protein
MLVMLQILVHRSFVDEPNEDTFSEFTSQPFIFNFCAQLSKMIIILQNLMFRLFSSIDERF